MAIPTMKVNKSGDISYQGCVRIKGFDHHYKTFGTLAAAEEYQRDTDRKIRKEQRDSLDPRAWLPASGDLREQRLREVLTKYGQSLSKAAWQRSTLSAVLDVCGDPTIGQLFPSWIKTYILRARNTVTIQGRPYAWQSIKHQLCVINTAIKWRADQLNINPPAFVVTEKAFDEAGKAEGLRREDRDNQRDRRFEEGEEVRLMATLDELGGQKAVFWSLFVRFAIETGARLQEIAWAQWREIDATGEFWHIPGKHSKTKSRSMPLTDEAIRVLAKLRELRAPDSLRIFHSMPTTKQISDDFATYAARTGLVDFRFHDLRHEGISRFVLTQIKLPIKVIMSMVGHSSIEMIDRYAKLRPNEMRGLIIRSSK